MRKRPGEKRQSARDNWRPEFDGIFEDEDGTRHVRAMVLGEGGHAVYGRKTHAGKQAANRQVVRPNPKIEEVTEEKEQKIETLGIEGRVSLIDNSVKVDKATR